MGRENTLNTISQKNAFHYATCDVNFMVFWPFIVSRQLTCWMCVVCAKFPNERDMVSLLNRLPRLHHARITHVAWHVRDKGYPTCVTKWSHTPPRIHRYGHWPQVPQRNVRQQCKGRDLIKFHVRDTRDPIHPVTSAGMGRDLLEFPNVRDTVTPHTP